MFAAAQRELETLEADHPGKQSHLDRADDRYEEVVDGFDDPVDADVSALQAAAQGTSALHAFVASSNGKRALNDSETDTVRTVSVTTVVAANRTARWRLAKAEWTLDHARSNLSKGQLRSLESHLENARRAYERAEKARDPIDSDTKLQRSVSARAKAIRQYHVGYRQATLVLERLDRLDVEPNLTDTDGDGVSDARERELGTNATLADTDADGIDDGVETLGGFPIDSDGDLAIDALDSDSDADHLPDYVEGRADTDANGIENFRDPDDDGDTIPTRTEVEDGKELFLDYDYDGTFNWLDTDADGDGASDRVEGTVDHDNDTVPAYLDNDKDEDGLPDFYEKNVTGTDPTDNDSDAPATAVDDGDDGVIDGMEDFDNDTLGAFREYTLGTDPFEADTDGDGLSDGFEHRTAGVDPLTADTDGDGTLDGAADPDGDGLTNAEEADAHSALRVADTDGDGITDGQEVANGTNPIRADSDDDGLLDPEEPELGTDPTDPDTDDDGVLDGNETFERTVTDAETGVQLDLRGQGAVEADITEQPSYFSGTNATAGPTVRVQNRTDFDNATVRIPIDESVPESAYEDLVVYKWNGSVEGRWHPVNTTIKNGTAVANVSSFSFFTVLDTDEWTGFVDLGPGGGNATPVSFANLSEFQCENSCNVTNETTLVLGGEPSARKITVEQGGETFEVVPLSNGQTIERFYNYGNAEINSPLPVAKSDVSRLFFWSGPEGLSLVLIHDKPRDGSGAAVSMDFDGLPGSGYWVVRDDSGDFGYSGTSPDWSWNNDNTDGGAFRGGLTNTSVTITPYFNDEAVREPLTPGTLDQWQVVTGRATNPRNISLDMDEPVTLTVPEAPDTGSGGGDDTSDEGNATFTTTIAPGTQGLTVAYQTEQTDVNPVATLTATDGDGTTVTKDLTIGTVGTVQETVNVSGLSGEVNFSVDVSGVNARLQLVTEQTRKDSDGDGLPDVLEKQTWTMSNGPGETFTTSPYNADTDGDGLNDSEEVTFAPVGEGDDIRFIARTTSNPAKYDTDGDGISDAVELRGWDTLVARDPGVAKNYVEAVRNNESDAEDLLTSISVGSSPLKTDTDGDGLSDGEEKALGLAPSNPDTDQDSIRDDEEYENQWYARLHDFRPPRTQGWVDTDGDRENYRVTITLHDQSGVGVVGFYKGERRASQDYFGQKHVLEDAVWFSIDRGAVDQIGTALSGYVSPATVKVVARDVHGTEVERKFYGPNNFGKIAEGIAQTSFPFGGVGTWVQTSSVAFFGELSGLSQGVNVFATDLVRTAYVTTHPSEYDDAARRTAQALGQLKTIATQSEKRHQAFTAIVQYYGNRRQQLNPFEDGGKYQEAFAIGYSVGYAGSFLVPVYAEAKAAQAAARLPYIAALVRAGGTVKASIKGATVGSALWTGGRIANRLPDVNFRVGRRIDDVEVGDRAKSVIGQTADTLRRTPLPEQRRIARLADDARGQRVFDWLTSRPNSDRYAKGLTYLKRTGSSGKRLLSELRPQPRQYLIDLRDKAALQRQLTEAYAAGDVEFRDIGRVVRRYDSYDAARRAEIDELVESTGPSGVKLVGKADADTVTALTDGGPGDTRFRRAVARAADGDAIDSYDQLDRAVETIEDLPQAARIDAKDLVQRSRGAGLEFIDETDDTTLRALLTDDAVTPGELAGLTRRYADLDVDDQRTLRRSLDEVDTDARRELVTSIAEADSPELTVSGLRKLRQSDSGSLDDFFDFESENADDVRRVVLGNVGWDRSSVTPAKAFQFADDVDSLRTNPQVDGLESVLDDIEDVSPRNSNNVKGAMFEVRYTKHYIDNNDIPSSATVRMDYNLDGSIDIDDALEEETKVEIIREIAMPGAKRSDPDAGDTFESLTEAEQDLYDETFTTQTQLDMVTITGPDGSQRWVYYEAKSGTSSSAVDPDDIQKKLGRLKAMKELSEKGLVKIDGDAVTITDVEMRLASPKAESDINGNALRVLRESDGQNPDNDLIRDDIDWGDSSDSDDTSATNASVVQTPATPQTPGQLTGTGSSGVVA
ncbi:hypothetical protein [Haloarchaeobius amylolyticus]|uniref:hypothetical protein n=1 Tax=Haloarchaeobius amylolyticus TaxID=1198296 RepID=UPI00226EBDA1